MPLGQLLINHIRKVWHHFHRKYKKLSTKLIILSFSRKIFLKIVPKPMHLGHSLTFAFIILFQSNATSTIFSQKILSSKLLLVFNWDNHFKLHIKKKTKKQQKKIMIKFDQTKKISLGTQQNVTIFLQYLYFQPL